MKKMGKDPEPQSEYADRTRRQTTLRKRRGSGSHRTRSSQLPAVRLAQHPAVPHQEHAGFDSAHVPVARLPMAQLRQPFPGNPARSQGVISDPREWPVSAGSRSEKVPSERSERAGRAPGAVVMLS